MIEVNGKEYEINLDIKLGSQKLMRKIMNNPEDKKTDIYIEMLMKDLLIPEPTSKELFNFRFSDIKKIMTKFAEESKETNSDFKKKRSQ